MATVSVTTTLQYENPGPVTVSSTFINQATYQASSVGFIEVPDNTADATEFDVPFGDVGAVKAIWVKNETISTLNVVFNADDTVTYSIPPGGCFAPLLADADGADAALTAVTLVSTAIITEPGQISYLVFGDE